MFNKNRLSQAVLTAVMGAAISAPALAQGTDPLIEEVYVTGIRASLERAMDIKRESSGGWMRSQPKILAASRMPTWRNRYREFQGFLLTVQPVKVTQSPCAGSDPTLIW